MRIKIWAVVGGEDAGKTSVIGGLTYRPTRRGTKIISVPLASGGTLDVRSIKGALQELGISPDQAINTFRAAAAKVASKPPRIVASAFNILIALRIEPIPPRGRIPEMPAGIAYLSAFSETGWDIASIALLNSTRPDVRQTYSRFGVPLRCVAQQPDIGQKTALVRTHFGWA